MGGKAIGRALCGVRVVCRLLGWVYGCLVVGKLTISSPDGPTGWSVRTIGLSVSYHPVLTHDPGHVLWCVMLACFDLCPWSRVMVRGALWCVVQACFDL